MKIIHTENEEIVMVNKATKSIDLFCKDCLNDQTIIRLTKEETNILIANLVLALQEE